MSVRRKIIWGVNVHSTHKGEVLFLSSKYIKKAIKNFEAKLYVQKG